MPARDIYHNAARHALIKDGWTITDDPLRMRWGAKDLYVDLAAQRLIVAEKHDQKIGVEVKSFLGRSAVTELEHALGQYMLYHAVMQKVHPDRTLYLAVPAETWNDLFVEPVGLLVREQYHIRYLVFLPQREEIVQWIPKP